MEEIEADHSHSSVLLDEAIRLLGSKDGGLFIDATLGLGGHTEAILRNRNTKVIGIDQDAEAIDHRDERRQVRPAREHDGAATTAAAYLLGRSWRRFPTGTVHLAVVDPGVGTSRSALCLAAASTSFPSSP